MERQTPFPGSLDKKNFDCFAVGREVRLGRVGPFFRDLNMTTKLLIKADFREPTITDDYLGFLIKRRLKQISILLNGVVVMGLRAGEVKSPNTYVPSNKIVFCVLYDCRFANSIGSKYNDGARIHTSLRVLTK